MSKPKQPRKELTSLRLEPKVKYLAEIAARVQRRSLTNYIEWAIEESLNNIILSPSGETVEYMAQALWDIYEHERFIKLALQYPELLNYEEQLIWKIVSDPSYGFISILSIPLRNKSDPKIFRLDALMELWDEVVKASMGDENAKAKIRKYNASFIEQDEPVPF